MSRPILQVSSSRDTGKERVDGAERPSTLNQVWSIRLAVASIPQCVTTGRLRSRIRRLLRIAQHVIKALLPWLLPAHQIFERARYSASKLFHFEPNSRNSCSDAARESIALSSDSIEDCALLKAARVVELVSDGSDGFQLLNVLLKPSRRLPNRLQTRRRSRSRAARGGARMRGQAPSNSP